MKTIENLNNENEIQKFNEEQLERERYEHELFLQEASQEDMRDNGE